MEFTIKNCVQYFLMSSYLYNNGCDCPLSDNAWDCLCAFIEKNWDQITHEHKKFIKKEDLHTGTSMYLTNAIIPERVKNAANTWVKNYKIQ